MHDDDVAFLPLPFGAQGSKRGLMMINHKYTGQDLLFPDGMKT